MTNKNKRRTFVVGIIVTIIALMLLAINVNFLTSLGAAIITIGVLFIYSLWNEKGGGFGRFAVICWNILSYSAVILGITIIYNS